MGPYASIAVLLGLGAWNVWCGRSPRLRSNPAIVSLSRIFGFNAVRNLLIVTGVLMFLLGLFGLGMALNGR